MNSKLSLLNSKMPDTDEGKKIIITHAFDKSKSSRDAFIVKARGSIFGKNSNKPTRV